MAQILLTVGIRSVDLQRGHCMKAQLVRLVKDFQSRDDINVDSAEEHVSAGTICGADNCLIGTRREWGY